VKPGRTPPLLTTTEGERNGRVGNADEDVVEIEPGKSLTFTGSDYKCSSEMYEEYFKHYQGDGAVERWRELGDLLIGRPGWHFSFGDGRPLWSLGTSGASLCNIYVQSDGKFHLFDYLEDSEVSVGTVGEIEAWLEEDMRELLARRPPPVQLHLVSHNNWELLLSNAYLVRVTWSDDRYSATVNGLAHEPTFHATYEAVIRSAREMIVREFYAPIRLADEIRIVEELDDRAAAARQRSISRGGE
jgi:hypothetical protein